MHAPSPPPHVCSYYSSEAELHRIFKSVNGIIFPGGLTDLWMDSPCEPPLLHALHARCP